MPREKRRPELGLKQLSPDPGDEEPGSRLFSRETAPGFWVLLTPDGGRWFGARLKIDAPGVRLPLPPSVLFSECIGFNQPVVELLTSRRVHKTLGTTPAVAAGVTDHVWKLSEIIGLLADAENAVPIKRSPYKNERSKDQAA